MQFITLVKMAMVCSVYLVVSSVLMIDHLVCSCVSRLLVKNMITETYHVSVQVVVRKLRRMLHLKAIVFMGYKLMKLRRKLHNQLLILLVAHNQIMGKLIRVFLDSAFSVVVCLKARIHIAVHAMIRYFLSSVVVR